MMFSNLPAGNYSVKAYGKTSTGAVAAKCETSVTIVAGETTTTTLHLSRLEHWTVTFMNADGSTLSTQDISDGYKATKPADPAPVSGKLFSGWTTDAVPSDSSPLFNFNTPITGDTTLQPVFGVITYIVKYVSAAGDFADVSFTAATASEYELPSTSGVAGLTFDNWYSDANFTTAVDVASVRDITTFTKKDDIHYEKTIYAKWTAHVEFQGENSTGTIITLASDEDVTYGGKVSNPGTPTAPTGATFGGWYTGTFNAGTGKVTLGSEYDFNTAVTGDMILYAKWNFVMHNVTYVSVPQDVPDGTETEFREIAGIPTLPSITPAASSGLTFVGWTDDENFTLDTTPITSVPANTTEDVTLYAIWKVPVIMNPNNGTSPTEYDVIYNKTFNESVPNPIPTSMATGLTKSGAESYEWYKTNSATVPTTWPETAFDKTAPITEKTYLHAKWLYKDFTGSYDEFMAAEFVTPNTAATAYNVTITSGVSSWMQFQNLGKAIGNSSYSNFKGVYMNLDLSTCGSSDLNNYLSAERVSGIATYLTGIVLPNGITRIPSRAFFGCSGITGSITIPNTVTEICANAFYGCSGITGTIIIPDSVTEIAYTAFCDCTGITGVSFGTGVTTATGFDGCSSLSSITYGSNVTVLESFGGSALSGTLTIPDGIIEVSGFSDCPNITDVVIGNNVTEISGFKNCTGLTGTFTIPASVEKIHQGTLYGCTGLTDISVEGENSWNRRWLDVTGNIQDGSPMPLTLGWLKNNEHYAYTRGD